MWNFSGNISYVDICQYSDKYKQEMSLQKTNGVWLKKGKI